MKQFLKAAGLLALTAAAAMAQLPGIGTGGTQGAGYNPVNSAWWIYALVYGIYAAIIGCAILWHCMHGALGTHEGFGRIVNVLIFGAIGFAAVYVITNLAVGTAVHPTL